MVAFVSGVKSLSDYWEKSLPHIISTVIGVIAGIIITLAVQGYFEFKENKRIRENFVFDLEVLIYGIDNQIRLLEDLCQKMSNPDSAFYDLEFLGDAYLLNFIIPDENQIRNAFLSGTSHKKKKVRQKLYPVLSSAKAAGKVLEEWQAKGDGFYKELSINAKEFEKQIKAIHTTFNRFVQEYGDSIMIWDKDPFLTEFTYHYTLILNSPNKSSMNYTYKGHLVPMKKVCEKYRTDKRATEMLNIVMDCIWINSETNIITSAFIDDMRELIHKFNEVQSHLKIDI